MKRKQIADWIRSHKKRTVLIVAVLILLLGGGVTALVMRSNDTVARTDTDTNSTEQEPTTVASPLTGVQVSPAAARRPVIGIVIENSPDARPQSGLHKAGVVFEAIAEGGITRFMTLWQENRHQPIGPVRSMRPYFIDWALAFDAAVAHVGGSLRAQVQAQKFKMKDLDQFQNPQAYWRATHRYAPHNVYTTSGYLDKLMKQKGYKTSDFISWPRKEANPEGKVTARTINIPISSTLYDVRYQYDRKTNTYKRWVGGQIHRDAQTKQQLAPSVVIAMQFQNGGTANSRWHYDLVGTGKVTIFQDGRVIKGVWTRNARGGQFRFKTGGGQPISLNPGQTWVTAVSPGSPVQYRP